MKYEMQYGSDTAIVELGMPEDPILVDGENFGMQVANGSCKTDLCMRLAAAHCWGKIYETEDDAEEAGLSSGTNAICVWEHISYSPIEE